MITMKYSDEQLSLAAKFVSFSEFLDRIDEESNHDLRLMNRIDKLLLHIYLSHREGRYLSKTEACRMIPAEHIETCKKYVDEALKRGFVEFEKDKTDRRRINVVPTKTFIAFVKRKAAAALDEVGTILHSRTTNPISKSRDHAARP